MYRLVFVKPVAGQSFNRLPLRAQHLFDMAFEPLAMHPQAKGPDLDVHQLSGYQNVWTLRIPPWRCVYAIDGDEVVVIVFGHRENVYVTLHNLLPPQKQFVTRSNLER